MKLLLTLFVCIAYVNTFACKCLETNLKDAVQRSDFVIAAKVIEVVDNGLTICHLSHSNDSIQIGYRVKVLVIKKYKGKLRSKTIIVDSGHSDCSICFRAGVEYLIFGYNNKGNYTTNACTRTAVISGNKDVEELKKK